MPSTLETKAFLAGYQVFAKNHKVIILDKVPSGEGIYRLKPSSFAPTAVLLEASGNRSDIAAFVVIPRPNEANSYPLRPLPGYYFLTTPMTGCQFIAYGPDRHNVTVEHNNYITDPRRYAARLQHILDQTHQYVFHIHDGGVNNIPEHSYNAEDSIQIFGKYNNAVGWQFFIRDHFVRPVGNLHGPF